MKTSRNKRGFTLVELIVVIAIMAVLAGTVTGGVVTVLHKQTDKVNFTFQCNEIAAVIIGWINDYGEDYPGFAKEVVGLSDEEITDLMISYAIYGDELDFGDYGQRAYEALKNRFSSLKWNDSYGVPEKKGTFSADIVDGAIYVMYRGKSNDYAEVGYKITADGVKSSFTVFPE